MCRKQKIDKIHKECHKDPVKMLNYAEGPLWTAIRETQASLDAIVQYIGRTSTQVRTLRKKASAKKRKTN